MNIWPKSFLCLVLIVGASSIAYAQQFQQLSSPTSATSGCPSTEVSYVFVWNGTKPDEIEFVTTGGATNVSSEFVGQTKVCNLRWASSGSIQARYRDFGQQWQYTGSISFSVTITTVGTISGPSSVCYGTGGTLSVSGNSSAVTWSYKNGASWVDMVSSSTGNLTSGRTFRAYIANACGTYYSADTVRINVTPLVQITSGPTLNPTSRYVGDTDPIAASVTASNAEAGNYTWTVKDFSNQTIASASSTNASTSLTNWSSTYTGTAVVSVTAHGCNGSIDTESTNITINAIPTPNFQRISSLPTTLCAGTVVRYKLTSTDPNISLSNISTSIINGGNSSVQNHAPGAPDEWSVTWMADGSFRVTYNITQGERTWTNQTLSLPFDVTAPASFSVTTDPVQPITICPGTSVSFQAVNGTALQWSSTMNDLSSQQISSSSFTVSPEVVTTYSVTGVEVNCGQPISESIVVNMRSVPSITFDPSIPAAVCVSTPGFQLSASPNGGSWTVDGSSVAQTFTAASHHSTPTQESSSHTITYAYTDQYGCAWSYNKSITIHNPPPPAAMTLAADHGEPYTAKVVAGENESYKWYNSSSGGATINIGTQYQATYTTATTYYLARTRADLPSCEGTLRGTLIITPFLNNYNYVREEIMLDAGVTTTSQIEGLTVNKKSMVTNYVDGLGRPMQTVSWQASPNSMDMVQPIEYDTIGREANKYLPYTSDLENGWYRKKAIKGLTGYNDSEQAVFYSNSTPNIASDSKPFATTIFEPSPLNRVIEQGAPGEAWQPITTERTIKKQWLLNGTNEVLLFNVDSNGTVFLSSGASMYYSPNTLFCNKTIDEQENDILEFVDKEGRTICKKVKAGSGVYASTYYIYDDFGNLVVVIPPEGIAKLLTP